VRDQENRHRLGRERNQTQRGHFLIDKMSVMTILIYNSDSFLSELLTRPSANTMSVFADRDDKRVRV